MNIINRPHMRHAMRGVSEEKRKAIQYATDKRREEQGKTVIHLHEKPPPFKPWPSQELMQTQILAFHETNGRLPERIITPFKSLWGRMGWPVRGLAPNPMIDMSDGRRFVEMTVVYDPDAPAVTVA